MAPPSVMSLSDLMVKIRQRSDMLPSTGIVGPISGGVVTGGYYMITVVGSTTAGQWQAIGLPVGITPAPGVGFISTTTGAGTGTGQVQLLYLPSLTANLNLFVSDPELIGYIQQSQYELYDILIETYEDQFVQLPPARITTDGVNTYFPIPDGTLYGGAKALYKLYGVDLGLDASNNALVTLSRFNFIDRNRYVFPQLNANALGPFNLQYRMIGNSIYFVPLPSANQPIQLWYYPVLTPLQALTDTVDGISGWTEYIITDCAIKCGQKEETDVSVLLLQKGALLKRIESAAQKRDVGAPQRISDTRTSASRWGRSGSPGDYGGFGGF